MEFKTIADVKHDPWSLLIYGPPKVGKTVFVCGAPKPILLSVDQDGEISLRNHPELADVAVEQTRTFAAVVKVLKAIKKEKPTEIQTIIIDTVTTLQNEQRIDMVDENEILTSDRWVFNQNTYSINNMKINVLVRLLMELKKTYNIILTAHLKEETVGPQNNTRIVARPALSGALLASVMATVNGVYALEGYGVGKRRLTVEGNALLIASGRYKIGKPSLPEPKFDDLRKFLER